MPSKGFYIETTRVDMFALIVFLFVRPPLYTGYKFPPISDSSDSLFTSENVSFMIIGDHFLSKTLAKQ